MAHEKEYETEDADEVLLQPTTNGAAPRLRCSTATSSVSTPTGTRSSATRPASSTSAHVADSTSQGLSGRR